MSRIDAIVASQAGEASRPRQAIQDRTLQAQQAQRQTMNQPPAEPVSADDLRAVAAQMKQVVEAHSSRRLSFKVNDTGTMYVEVRDQLSGEVLRQIPSEEVLRLRDQLDEMVGMFVDEKA